MTILPRFPSLKTLLFDFRVRVEKITLSSIQQSCDILKLWNDVALWYDEPMTPRRWLVYREMITLYLHGSMAKSDDHGRLMWTQSRGALCGQMGGWRIKPGVNAGNIECLLSGHSANRTPSSVRLQDGIIVHAVVVFTTVHASFGPVPCGSPSGSWLNWCDPTPHRYLQKPASICSKTPIFHWSFSLYLSRARARAVYLLLCISETRDLQDYRTRSRSFVRVHHKVILKPDKSHYHDVNRARMPCAYKICNQNWIELTYLSYPWNKSVWITCAPFASQYYGIT